MNKMLALEQSKLLSALPWLAKATDITFSPQPGGDSVAIFCRLGEQMWQRVRVMVAAEADVFSYELRLQMSKPGAVLDDGSEGQVYQRLAACESLVFDDPLMLLVVMAGLRSVEGYTLM